ncbi:MAG: hypothetical protein AAGB93_15680 [Planctomycetota bacterium]
MTRRTERSEERVAERLRRDAMRIDAMPSNAARARLRSALEGVTPAGDAPRAAAPGRWSTRRRLVTTCAAAVALAISLVGVRAMRTAVPPPPSTDAVVALRTAFDPLLGAPRLPARTAAPLQGELLAMVEDAAAVADEVLSRLPGPLERACARRIP